MTPKARTLFVVNHINTADEGTFDMSCVIKLIGCSQHSLTKTLEGRLKAPSTCHACVIFSQHCSNEGKAFKARSLDYTNATRIREAYRNKHQNHAAHLPPLWLQTGIPTSLPGPGPAARGPPSPSILVEISRRPGPWPGARPRHPFWRRRGEL